MTNKCYLCESEKPLIKAHIIPRKFYNPLKEFYKDESHGDKVPRVYSEDIKSKQWQSGLFDNNILCKECDGKIGIWDEYAQDLLLKQHQCLDTLRKPNELSYFPTIIDRTSSF